MTTQPDTSTDFNVLYNAICATIRAAFPVFQTVEAYRPDRKNFPVPACLIELIDMDPLPDEDPGTEQIAVQANFEAQIILGRRAANLHLEVRRLAAAVARLTRDQRWGLKVGAAYPTAIKPDAFEPDLDQFEVWRGDTAHRRECLE